MNTLNSQQFVNDCMGNVLTSGSRGLLGCGCGLGRGWLNTQTFLME